MPAPRSANTTTQLHRAGSNDGVTTTRIPPTTAPVIAPGTTPYAMATTSGAQIAQYAGSAR